MQYDEFIMRSTELGLLWQSFGRLSHQVSGSMSNPNFLTNRMNF